MILSTQIFLHVGSKQCFCLSNNVQIHNLVVFMCKTYITTKIMMIFKGSLQKLQYDAKFCYCCRKSVLGSKNKKILDEHLTCFLCIYLLNTYDYSFICMQAQTYFTFKCYISTYLKKKRPFDKFVD